MNEEDADIDFVKSIEMDGSFVKITKGNIAIDVDDWKALAAAFKDVPSPYDIKKILWAGDGIVVFETRNEDLAIDAKEIRVVCDEKAGELLLHGEGGTPYQGKLYWVFSMYGEEMYIIVVDKDEVRIYLVDDWEFVLSSLEGHNGYEPVEVIKRGGDE